MNAFVEAMGSVAGQVGLAQTETQTRVWEALGNENWGPTSTQLKDITRDVFSFETYSEVRKRDAAAGAWDNTIK